MDNYKKSLIENRLITEEYFRKSIEKTEQQKFLEKLLFEDGKFLSCKEIGDIACGGGTLSFHLANSNNLANFTLVDYLEQALSIAREINEPHSDRMNYLCNDIYRLAIDDNAFDMTFCLQTLSWLEKPEQALLELIRVTKLEGKIYLSSLFNIDHDVDVYSKVFDHTRFTNGEKEASSVLYNTYSLKTLSHWLDGRVSSFKLHKFNPNVSFYNKGRGLGTYTKPCLDGDLLQITGGGILLNWYILEIIK